MAKDVRTALSIPTEPWETAKSIFLAGLTPAELKIYEGANLENLFYDASATQKKHASSSRSWIIQERITSFVEGIEDYGKALDVFANTSSLILCPLWGSIRVVIQLATEAGKFQEKVVDMLAQIGDVIPRFLPLAMVLQGNWSSFRQGFENTMMKFRKHQKLVEKEASLSHQIEAAKSRELELAQRMQNDRIRTRFNMLSALRATDYEIKHTKLLAAKHPGTNEWMKENPRYKDWMASPASDCLSCYGIPGSGKSILSASITSWLAEKLDADTMLCYYYCDYTDVASFDYNCLMASLIKQALVRLPLEQIDDRLDFPFQEGMPPPSMTASQDFLIRLFQNFKTIYIIIDAVDEFVHENQRHTLDLITRLLKIPSSSFTVRIFITSRSADHSIRTALKDHECINLSTAEVKSDISGYIEDVVHSLTEENPLLKNESIKQNVLSALTSGAQGMFLWAKFQVLEIAEALSESDIEEALDNLPKDLGETYMRIIQKAHRRGGTQRITLVNKICRWIACAQRPLRIEELEEAMAVEPTDTYLHRDRIALGSGHRLVSACGNLVMVHDADGTVDFAHHTVKQFLCSEKTEAILIDGVGIHLNTEKAHHELGEICVAYLSFSDFETQIAKKPKQVEIKPKEAEAMIWNKSIPFRKFVKPIISGRRSNQKATDAQHSDSLYFHVPLESKLSHVLEEQYTLLEYITDFWCTHTAELSPKTTDFWHVFENLALERTLPFDFRPWTRLTYRSDVEVKLTQIYTKRLESLGAIRSGVNNRFWGPSNPLDTNRNRHLDEMCLYTWGLRQGSKSILQLSKKEAILEYVRLSYPDLEPLIDHIVFSVLSFSKTPGFWNSSNIVSQVARTQVRTQEPNKGLSILFSEYQRWVDGESNYFHSLIAEAIPIAYHSGHYNTYQALLDHCIIYNIDTPERKKMSRPPMPASMVWKGMRRSLTQE